MLEGFQDSFRAEAEELLQGLEQALLQLEEDPENGEMIAAVFRTMHTIKGSAGMFGFDDISAFAHHVESALDGVRKGHFPVTPALIDTTLTCRDHIRNMLADPENPEHSRRSGELQDLLQHTTQPASADPTAYPAAPVSRIGAEEGPVGEEGPDPEGLGDPAAADSSGPVATWHIRFEPHVEILTNGTNPLLLLEELHDLGDCTVVPNTGSIPALKDLELLQTHVSWDVFLTTTAGRAAIQDVFMFVDDRSPITIRLIEEIDFSDDVQSRRLGQILVDRGVVDPAAVRQALASQRRLGQVLQEQGVAAEEINSALQEQEHTRRTREKLQTEASTTSSIRVQSEKLDDLVDLVGELVTLQARLTQIAENEDDESGLTAISENFERLIGELRDNTMSIRMLPIASSFSRFRRLVRDLSRDLEKDVDLVTQGGETEVDKTVIERLHDPLVHVIRNSIDHGLENPDGRRAAGKNPTGTITLRARHVGANVEIRVEDDGRGLDRDRIIAKAVANELISSDQKLDDREIYDLLFMPGFSTAETVTTVSGRGVGMDVVRREVDSIGGTVMIESTPGRGTALVMTIPLTLAIIEGLLVCIGDERFVFPLASVEECIEYRRSRERGGTVSSRGELLPIVDLRREFGITGTPPDIEQIVVVGTTAGRVGFVVDTVIGSHQTVIKNLGQLYHDIDAVGGATILGDGTVALIVDVQRLTSRITDDKRNTER